jgi:hypothetical protein
MYLHKHNKCIPPTNPNAIPKPMHSYPNQNLITELKYHGNEVDQHKMKLKQKPNTAKKQITGSSNLPFPITTHLYY